MQRFYIFLSWTLILGGLLLAIGAFVGHYSSIPFFKDFKDLQNPAVIICLVGVIVGREPFVKAGSK